MSSPNFRDPACIPREIRTRIEKVLQEKMEAQQLTASEADPVLFSLLSEEEQEKESKKMMLEPDGAVTMRESIAISAVALAAQDLGMSPADVLKDLALEFGFQEFFDTTPGELPDEGAYQDQNLVTTGKFTGRTWAEARQDLEYVSWVMTHTQKSQNQDLIALREYFEKKYEIQVQSRGVERCLWRR